MMGDIVQALKALNPGDSVEISYLTLREIELPEYWAKYPIADCLLASITGELASNEYWWVENELSKNIKFGRLIDPLPEGKQTWVHEYWKSSYKQDSNGYWELCL